MLIKTEEFDKRIRKDIAQLTMNYNFPPKIQGSYELRPFGSIITDIDLQESVRVFENLHTELYRIFLRKGNFQFVQLFCGTFDQFIPPWYVGRSIEKFSQDSSLCRYEPKKAEKWLKNMKGEMDQETYKKISNILLGEKLTLGDLLGIRDILENYGRILWTLEDVRIGYKENSGKKYYLEELMRKGHVTTAMFLYKYEDNYCTADVSYVDRKYMIFPSSINYYYKNEYYRILKSYKWYLHEEFRGEYTETMVKLGIFSAILNRLKLLRNKMVPENIRKEIQKDVQKETEKLGIKSDKNLDKIVKFQLNIRAKKYAEYYRNKIQEKYEPMLQRYETLQKLADIPITRKIIEERKAKNLECPFFAIENRDLDYLVDLSVRIKIPYKTLFSCFLDISEKYDIDLQLIINALFLRNSLSIKSTGKSFEVVQLPTQKSVKKFSVLKDAQRYILLGN